MIPSVQLHKWESGNLTQIPVYTIDTMIIDDDGRRFVDKLENLKDAMKSRKTFSTDVNNLQTQVTILETLCE